MEMIIEGISILQVLLDMIVILVLILNSYNMKRKMRNKNFYFIVNLAATDIVGFFLMMTCIEIEKVSWSYKKDTPDKFSEKMTSGCQVLMAILNFAYMNSVFATISLTVDRFFFIYKPLTYECIMNKGSCLNSRTALSRLFLH